MFQYEMHRYYAKNLQYINFSRLAEMGHPYQKRQKEVPSRRRLHSMSSFIDAKQVRTDHLIFVEITDLNYMNVQIRSFKDINYN